MRKSGELHGKADIFEVGPAVTVDVRVVQANECGLDDAVDEVLVHAVAKVVRNIARNGPECVKVVNNAEDSEPDFDGKRRHAAVHSYGRSS